MVDDHEDYQQGEAPAAHKVSHQDGGTDEISVAGLSGELADDQPPKAHDLAGAKHNADSLADLNAKITDATLLDDDAINVLLAFGINAHSLNATVHQDAPALIAAATIEGGAFT